ncbi:hypothetical protein JCM1840_002137 [Sporobolomyces johnsonii]
MTEPAPAGTRYSLSVLSTHTVDSSPALLVAFDSHRYLFNTPESISRISLQNKVGLRKVGHVFLGDLEQSAGLPGFVLSTVEAGNDRIAVVGPQGTEHYLASCRFFTRRDKLSLKITSPPSSASLPLADSDPSASVSDDPALPPPIHADSNLVVYAFPLVPSAESTDSTALPAAAAISPQADTPMDDPSSLPPLKRKRSSTSPSPPPRSKSPPAEPSQSPSPDQPAFDPSSPSFNPRRLRGADADHWRNLVLRDMFRGTAFDSPSSSSSTPSATPPTAVRRPGVQTPSYLPQPLPPLAPDFTPTVLSYLVVGPKLRGRFLPEKAKELGVKPGKAFSRLIAGERVWVPAMTAAPDEEKAQKEEKKDMEGEGQAEKKESKKERLKRLKAEREREEKALENVVEGEGEGKWVDSADCMGPGQDATAFTILNIPTPAHLPSLIASLPPSLLSPASLGPQTVLRTVFHFLGPSVLSSPLFASYLSALQSALPGVEHRISSADHVQTGKNEVTFGPSALLNLRLRELDAGMFRLPKYSFVPPPGSGDDSPSPSVPAGTALLVPNTHFSSALSLLPADRSPLGGEVRSFNFLVPSPTADVEASRLKPLEKPKDVQDRAAAAWREFKDKVREARESVAREAQERSAREVGLGERERVEGALVVTPLGTGSAVPSKYRNVSSTLLHLPPSRGEGSPTEYILLDAGEGTWGQLARRFGRGKGEEEDSAEDVLRGIKMIFVSHLHQDHHAGLTTILKERAKLDPPPPDPLTIICPPNARTYLLEQHQLFDLGLSYSPANPRGREIRFLDNYLLEPGKEPSEGSRAANAYADLKERLGLSSIVAVPVLHRCRCWGAVIEHSSGWKAVFSGDTMPCEALVVAGQDASLLVHEATIEDDMPEVARAKGHSTFAQAIQIATRMRARHLLLTHFSARYPKLPPLSSAASSDGAGAHHPVIATAFDLITLRLDEFWKMERYRDAMDALLSWDEADEDDRDELSGKSLSMDVGGEGAGEANGKKESKKKKKAKEKEEKGAAADGENK